MTSNKLESYDLELLERLKNTRADIAMENCISEVFPVFSDDILIHMAKELPCNKGELLQISNIDETKLKEYGEPFFKEIQKYCDNYNSIDSESNEFKKDELEIELEKYFGYHSFLPKQKEIIKDILNKKDVVAILATGSGKSVCYQLPAMLFDGLTVVVSPLIALMKDQVDELNENGIPAATLNSTLKNSEIKTIKNDISQNNVKILYVSPEKLVQKNFLDFLKNCNISLIAIDEAHCISMWGHQFRPDYRQLAGIRLIFPKIPIIALTATAIPEVQSDIIYQLNLNDYKLYIGSFNRKNLNYFVLPKKKKYSELIEYLSLNRNVSGIIYCLSRKNTEELAQKLQNDGFRAYPYHAGLSNEIRTKTQELFIKNEIPIICATVAFGMGINKPDVRYVVHWNVPKNIEAYFQETGRAGRDGETSDCILFYDSWDINIWKRIIEEEFGENQIQREVALEKISKMSEFCESIFCRRKYLLNYFGEKFNDISCDSCDVCLLSQETPDKTEIAFQKTLNGTEIARMIVQCISEINGMYGASHIAKIITGSKSRNIKKYNHDLLPSYNTGIIYTRKQWTSFIRELVSIGYLDQTDDIYPIVSLNKKSEEVFYDGQNILLTHPLNSKLKAISSSQKKEGYDSNLFEQLTQLRASIAIKIDKPPYMVFPDKSLKEMAIYYPCSQYAFSNIFAMSQSKIEKYGDIFISFISDYCRENDMPENYSYLLEMRAKRKYVILEGESWIQAAIRSLDKKHQKISRTHHETLSLLHQGYSISQIADIRGLEKSTIIGHFFRLILLGEDITIDDPVLQIPNEKMQNITDMFKEFGFNSLSEVKSSLGDDYSYEEIGLTGLYLISQELHLKDNESC